MTLSKELGITRNAAKGLMKETFAQHHGKDLYDHGKALEKEHHIAVHDAEIAARKVEKQPLQTKTQSYA